MVTQSRKPRSAYTPTQWKIIIEDFEKSGLTKGEFCHQRSLTPSVFARWKKKLLSPHGFQKRGRHVYTLEQQKDFIEDWRRSGLSKYAYCVWKNLTPSVFNGWVKEFGSLDPSPQVHNEESEAIPSVTVTTPELTSPPKPNPTAFFQENFVPLSLNPAPPKDPSTSNQKIEVVFAQGHRLSLQGSFDLGLLGSWLAPLLTKENEK